MSKLTKVTNQAFTIIEVLIATAVFSVVLLIVTAAIVEVNHLYYRGITEANVQNTARSTLDTISQVIQFNGGMVTPATGASPGTNYQFCVGNQQFSYRLGWTLTDSGSPNVTLNETPHGLYQVSLAGCNATSTPASLQNVSLTGGRELLGTNMRLSKLGVTAVGTDEYKVTVRIAYGANDLLSSPTANTASCKNQTAGTQFCAVSEFSTVVTKRVR
jgi:prepilin-type N-terminal cleavage/methylation domain-containing protein